MLMRWFLRSLAVVALLWAIFVASPYVALYNLAKAAEARDLAAIEERVDFVALRRSLARQIAASYARVVGGERAQGATAQIGAAAGVATLDPLIADYVSAGAVMRLVRDGWPALLDREATSGGSARNGLAVLEPAAFMSGERLRQLWELSEWRGFTSFHINAVQPGSTERLQLQFRLSGLSWRLSGIELPEDLKQRLAQELAARQSASR
jgi:Protein of unknown function (DUF2939)